MTNNNYPVALFLYRRPQTVTRLLTLISDSGVTKIYVFVDGPKTPVGARLSRPSPTNQVRKLVKKFAKLHPKLKIISKFSRKNYGLKHSLVTGLNTVFSREHAAIVLEDDTIPHPDFFPFMTQMLTKYKNEVKVMSITGSGITGKSNYSYDFSKYQLCWGWATWSRAWDCYDFNLNKLNSKKWQQKSKNQWDNPAAYWYWKIMLFLTEKGQINTWSFQWSFAHMNNSGLAIIPATNLIQNVGFDIQATNTITKSPLSKKCTNMIKFPLKHPQNIADNKSLSKSLEYEYYLNPIAMLGMIRQLFYYLIGKK